ncbi:MAG: hypothetical protein AAF614_20845 [Chloroflexota bacterium]
MKIITDRDLADVPIQVAIAAIKEFFAAAANGHVVTPPRHTFRAGDGGLTFTIGAELETSKTVGFRVYDTYPGRSGTDTDQIIAVYSTEKSQLKGLVISSKLGAMRTAAINGLATSLLAKPAVETVCLIGAGFHAYYQMQAILAVRSPRKVIVCNRTPARAEALIEKLAIEYDIEFVLSKNVEQSVREADIVMCATSSSSPVLESSWLKSDAYISSIGPKFKDRHELPLDIAAGASILVTDAPQQLTSYPAQYFLDDVSIITPLENVSSRPDKKGYAVFLSSGRSGTEVIVADRIINYLAEQTAKLGANNQ